MRITWKEQFKEDIKRLEKRFKDPKPFRNAFNKAMVALQTGRDLSEIFVVNKLRLLGPGWYDCYLYDGIVMIYRVYGQSILLLAVGYPKEFLDRL